MSEKDQENQQDNTPKKVEAAISGKVSVSYDPKPFDNIVHAINETNKTQKQEEEINNGFNRRQAEAQENANRINNKLFLGTVAMFIVTALIFWWTHLGVEAAAKAADAAVKADSISIATLKWDSAKAAKADSDESLKFKKQYDLAKQTLNNSEMANNRAFNFQKKGLETQQKNLNETKSEFNALNRPFVEITDLKIDSMEEGQKPVVRFNFINAGKFPAQILYYISVVGIGAATNQIAIKEFERSPYRKVDSINQILTSYPLMMPTTVTKNTELKYFDVDSGPC